MDRLRYILEQYRRTFGKVYENYCIERIINKLDNPELIFVTQKMFRKTKGDNQETGGIALADLYFPQLKLTVEIDEAYHKNNKKRDSERTKAILEKLSKMHTVVPFEPEEERIIAYNQDLTSINKQIDDIVEKINNRINQLQFLKWDPIDTETIIANKRIDIQTEVSFPTIYEVSRLFNKGYKKGCQCSYFRVGTDNTRCWCPILIVADIPTQVKYSNEISKDGNEIYESHKDALKNDKFVQEYLMEPNASERRFVFGHYLTEQGTYAYIFQGIYRLNEEKTRYMNKRVWERYQDYIDLSVYFS